MKKKNRHNFKWICLLAALFLLLGAILPTGKVNAAGSPAAWVLTIDLSAEEPDAGAVLDSLQAAGVEAALQDGRLALQGSGSLEQLNSLLFDSGVDFLGGPVDLALILPAGSSALTLKLETRITSGYSWQVKPESGYIQEGEASFVTRYRAYGAPSIQTLALTSAGGGIAALIYQRPFDTAEALHASLSLTLEEPLTTLELLDPTPSAPVQSEASTLLGEENPLETLPQGLTLPSKWDWRAKGIVPPVRDQGGCGSCWAFGTVGVMESALKKAGGPLKDLSEQFLVSCNKEFWDCGGGLTAHMYHLNKLGKAQTKVGAVLEADVPYIASNGSCTVAYNHPYKLSNWKFITGSEWTVGSVNAIKTAIYTYGPITAGVCAAGGFYNYNGGVFAGNDDCGGYTNHQIILVGWDDATGSWILRNSWGPYWGENGYMRIKYHTEIDPHSRVGEGTSWVLVSNTALNLIYPQGTITDKRPDYWWFKVKDATKYQIRVFQGSDLNPLFTRYVSSKVCVNGFCRTNPNITLFASAYTWQARAYVNGKWQTWSARKLFNVIAP